MGGGTITAWQMIMGALAASFGGWAAVVWWTARRVIDSTERNTEHIIRLQAEHEQFRATIAESKKNSDIAITQVSEHGTEFNELRTRLMRLESRE